MSNIKSDIINNITVTMSVYIQDREIPGTWKRERRKITR